MPISREKDSHRFTVCPEGSYPYCIVLSSGKAARLPLGESLPTKTKAGLERKRD